MNGLIKYNNCHLCCSTCSALPSSYYSSTHSPTPFALQNLLPVGTIAIYVLNDGLDTICDHKHAEDGWHRFSATALFGRLKNEDDSTICRDLEFLLKQNFIRATCRIMGGEYDTGEKRELRVRIYIVPFDLGGMQGKLRVRKNNVLVPARKYMRNVLPRIIQNTYNWEGLQGGVCPSFFPHCKDSRTLSEHYGDLSSPAPVPMQGWENITTRLLDYNDDLSGLGMRSKLHKYQRRTVAAMMQRELDLKDVPDPLFIPLKTISGREFYLQPGTMEVLLERPLVAPWRGGILCEELGTGKTVMILALILSTLHQLPTPEESIVEERPILTPVSFAYFPTTECINARRRFFRGVPTSEIKIPSLTELLIHRVCTTQTTTVPDLRSASGVDKYKKKKQLEAEIDNLPIGEVIKHNVPFYHHYLEEPTNREREHRAGFSYSSKKSSEKQGPRIMYISGATLVVVPTNLFSQWAREILKHCEDERLRVLTLKRGTKMPEIKELAGNYDMVLMTYTRYTAEANASSVSSNSSSPCKCPTFPGTRILNCVCPIQTSHASPLMHIRWKRLVIDEGHVSGITQTVLADFTRQLSIERRWIVTGTPTAGLLGLSLGSGKGRKDEGDEEFESPSRVYSSSSRSITSSPIPAQTRVWSKDDRSDLNKLGNMMSDFIGIPQFRADPSLITTHIIEPLMHSSGPRPGAVEVLRRVMEGVMIRHRIEDVEKEVMLPPVSHTSVLLDLDPLAIKSYNALQATIAINAIDSQRTDQDYMFHPRNVEYLQLTVKNMSQIMFWSVDDRLYNVDQLVEDEHEHIEHAIERNAPPEDMELLYNAFKHIRLAANDPLWREINSHEDLAYRIYNMNENVFDAWSRIPTTISTGGDDGYVGFMHADRLIKLQDFMIKRPLVKEDQLLIQGKRVRMDDLIARRKFLEESQKKKSRSKNDDDDLKMLMVESTTKASSQEAVREAQELMEKLESMEKDESDEDAELMMTKPTSILLASSLLARVRIRDSASSKLNYIINDVLKHSPTEKFLIFSESTLTLAHVAEALRLIKVKFIIFTTQIEPQARQQLVLTFETSETYRVLLMEHRHGARGLNLISASRVIFCEPVWQADVESQAIKRAHRIGQTKPITVKTLAIRGTAEENMVARRHALRHSPEKLPKLIEEAGMRHFIANPKFIDYPPKDLPQLTFKLFNIPDLESIIENPSGITIKIPAAKPLSRKRARIDSTPKQSVDLAMSSSSSPKHSEDLRSILKKPEGPVQSRHITIMEPTQAPTKRKRAMIEEVESDEDEVLPTLMQTPLASESHSPDVRQPLPLPFPKRSIALAKLKAMNTSSSSPADGVDQISSPTLLTDQSHSPLPPPKRVKFDDYSQISQASPSSPRKRVSFSVPT